MWEPRRLTTLWTSIACCRDSFTFSLLFFTFYNSLEHTVKCSQYVTRRILVTAPTIAVPLPPAQVLSSQTPLQNWLCSESESESYVTTDGQSASLSWYKAPIRGLRPDFASVRNMEYVWQLRSWFRGSPSLTRGRVCLLYVPLALASAVFLGS
jgi:hypothetical protein